MQELALYPSAITFGSIVISLLIINCSDFVEDLVLFITCLVIIHAVRKLHLFSIIWL